MTLGHRPAPSNSSATPFHLQEAYCAYAIILMALYWCTEALPLAVTALFPIILYPMMGIMDASEVNLPHPQEEGLRGMVGVCPRILVTEEAAS